MKANKTAFIFDVDGTLIDSNEAHARSWQEALVAHNFHATLEQIRPLIGMGGDQLLPILTGRDSDSPRGRKISASRSEIFTERYLPYLRPFPQARELLLALKDAGYQVLVASSSEKAPLKRLLRQAGVEDLIEDFSSADDALVSKPAPDILLAVMEAAKLRPQECWMVGDTPYDVAASRRARVDCLAVRSGGWRDEDLRGAVAIFSDVADLYASLDTSPLFARVAPWAGASPERESLKQNT